MTEEKRVQLLDGFICKAEEIAIGLRELSADLTAQADNFTYSSGAENQTNLLQNRVYDIMLRTDILERAAKAFLCISTIRHRAVGPTLPAATKPASDE